MEKTELVKLLDNIFIPLGFKRKGNTWVSNGKEINKLVNLQKSQYSNTFYINYGFIINSIPLNKWVQHTNDRLGSKNQEEQHLIDELLNLESNIDTSNRLIMLYQLIHDKIIPEFLSVETENDLLKTLKAREHLYTVAPIVLKHFNLTF